MSIPSYTGANVVTTDSFAGWIDKTNQIRRDMGSVVVTVANVPQPNTVNGAETTGNAHVEGLFSSSSFIASNALRGGTVSTHGTLNITSNTIFSDVNGTGFINVLSSINTLSVAANTTTFSSGVVNITSANTTIGDASLDALNVNATSDFNAAVNIDGVLTQTANAIFSGGLVNITSANTTIGDANTDALTVNATSTFANNATFSGGVVNITSANTTIGDANTDALTVRATSTFANNATFSGALVNITSANTTIGDASADALNVNATSDFNAAVNIDGVLTQTANATFSGGLVNITSANTTIGDASTDALTVRATSTFANNATFSGGVVNITSANTTIGDASADALTVNATSTFANNATFNGGLVNITSANTTIGDANTDILTVKSAANFDATMNVVGNAVFNANVSLLDNDYLNIGTGNDLQLYHTGIHSYIKDAGVGELIVDASTFRVMNAANTENMIVATENADVSLYHDNILRFATSLTGANVTGTFGTSGLSTLNSANVTNGLWVGGTSTLVGNTSFTNNATVSGNLAVTGTSTLTGNTSVGGTFGTSGLSTLNSANVVTTLLVGGTSTFSSGATFSGSVNITGANTTIGDASTDVLTVRATSSFANNAAFTKDVVVSGNTTIGDAITDTLTVNATSTLVGNTNFTNNVVISGNLKVDGTTTFASDVVLTVNSSISETATTGTLIVNGNSTLGDGANNDIVTLNSKVVNSIIPNVTNTYNIGSPTQVYSNIYATTLNGNLSWSNVTSKPSPTVTVTLTGDVAGSGAATLSSLGNGTASFVTTIQPNSVVLGTDTVGNYMSNVTAGSGITISHTPSEGSTATISHTDTSSVANLSVDSAGGTVLQDLSLTFDTFGHVTGATSASTNLDNRYPTVAFKTITIADLDSGYTWSELGNITANGLIDTLKFISGADIDIDVDSTNKAIRVQDTSTLSSVTGRGATTGSAISITNTTESTSAATGALKVSGGVGVVKNLYVGGTANVASSMTVGGEATFGGAVTIGGDLTVNGTVTTVNSTTVTYDDKNIELGSIAVPSDAAASGGGITLKGTTDKTLNWLSLRGAWTSSEHMELVANKAYYINGASVLSANTLGSAVTSSSLTSVGTVTTGTWNAGTIQILNGGTGATTLSAARSNLGILNYTAGTNMSLADTIFSVVASPTFTTVTATDFNTTSDISLKENITDIDNALDKVTRLRGTEFDWKATGDHTIGFIAQEVEEVVPELVVIDEETGIKSVKYGNVTALLVEAIKELKAEIAILKKGQ